MVGANTDDGLNAELAALQREQCDALEDSTFVGMTTEEQHAFEHRAQRITQIQRELGLRPEAEKNRLW